MECPDRVVAYLSSDSVGGALELVWRPLEGGEPSFGRDRSCLDTAVVRTSSSAVDVVVAVVVVGVAPNSQCTPA